LARIPRTTRSRCHAAAARLKCLHRRPPSASQVAHGPSPPPYPAKLVFVANLAALWNANRQKTARLLRIERQHARTGRCTTTTTRRLRALNRACDGILPGSSPRPDLSRTRVEETRRRPEHPDRARAFSLVDAVSCTRPSGFVTQQDGVVELRSKQTVRRHQNHSGFSNRRRTGRRCDVNAERAADSERTAGRILTASHSPTKADGQGEEHDRQPIERRLLIRPASESSDRWPPRPSGAASALDPLSSAETAHRRASIPPDVVR